MLSIANGPPQFIVTNQKGNLTLVGAVAFLMLMFLCRLYDTDHGDDDTDNRHYNTHNTDYCF